MEDVTALTLNSASAIVAADPQYGAIVQRAKALLPAAVKTIEQFGGKSETQYIVSAMVATHPTPLRNIRQLAANVNQSVEALREAEWSVRKAEIEAQIAERDAAAEPDALKAELKRLDAARNRDQVDRIRYNMAGALRKITHEMSEMEAIKRAHGITEITEAALEKEEDRYHVMTAFRQALTCARANGGRIDHGNQIYMTKLGINGGVAQAELSLYLQSEQQMYSRNVEPTYAMELDFLERMADRFAGYAMKAAMARGLDGQTPVAQLTEG